jgi:allantoinase
VADVDLLIRGGEPADVAVDCGRVVALGRELGLTARETIDARGLHVLAGAVDAHVHFNEPGRTDWEGWATGTAAAAAGGTTCVVEMPLNAHPPTVDGESFGRKLAAATASAVVDFALWGGLVPGNVTRMHELAELGVVGFKAFMCQSGIDDFAAADENTLTEGMAEAARLGLPVAVHAEDPALLQEPTGRGWRDFAASRPPEAELSAIAHVIELAAAAGCSLHVVHVSTGRGIHLVAEARRRGVDVTCETCPHYLLLSEDDLDSLGAVAKCAPPLRSAADREELRAQLEASAIDFVASDHSPARPWMKEGDDAFAVWGGISGCQSLLPLALTEDIPLELVTARPAARFRLPGKGRLEPGADADFVLVERDARVELRAKDLHYRHRQSPYVGRTMHGRIVGTWLRGRPVVPGEPSGRFVQPVRR